MSAALVASVAVISVLADTSTVLSAALVSVVPRTDMPLNAPLMSSKVFAEAALELSNTLPSVLARMT